MRKTHNTGHQGSPHANDETSVRLSWHCQLAEIPFIVYAGVVYVPWIQPCKADACV